MISVESSTILLQRSCIVVGNALWYIHFGIKLYNYWETGWVKYYLYNQYYAI